MSPLVERIRSEAPRVLKFGIVGVAATLIHTGVALLVLSRTGAPFLANLAGFLTAFLFSFLGHALWTFSMKAGRKAAAVRFFVVSGASFLFSTFVLGAARASGLLPDWASLLIAIGVVPVCNFLAGRFWAFREDARPRV